jgi:hypothetical protein
MPAVVGALTLVGLLAAAVPVTGGSTCPRPEEVSAELARILPSSGPTAGPSARLEQSGSGLRIELFDAAGALVGKRVLEGSARCADLAAASAVVIATWVAGLAPTAPPVEPPAAPPPSALPAPERLPYSFELGVGALGSYSNGFGLGVEICAALTPESGAYGAQVSVAALGAHDLSLGAGTATWQRFALGLGAHRRFRPGSWKIDVKADAVGALLAVAGDENNPEASSTRFGPGLSVGARATAEPGLWFGAFATGWLKGEEVAWGAHPKLPQFEVFLAAGVAFCSD